MYVSNSSLFSFSFIYSKKFNSLTSSGMETTRTNFLHWTYSNKYQLLSCTSFVERNSSKQTLIMTDIAVLLACRISIAVLIPTVVGARHWLFSYSKKLLQTRSKFIILTTICQQLKNSDIFQSVVPFAANKSFIPPSYIVFALPFLVHQTICFGSNNSAVWTNFFFYPISTRGNIPVHLIV